jgi:hypothetical protein
VHGGNLPLAEEAGLRGWTLLTCSFWRFLDEEALENNLVILGRSSTRKGPT